MPEQGVLGALAAQGMPPARRYSFAASKRKGAPDKSGAPSLYAFTGVANHPKG